MNKKVRVTIILITTLLILLIASIILFAKNKEKKELEFNQNIYNKFVNKIENKDTFLLYLNNSGKECFLCSDVDIMLKFYKEVYHLEIDNGDSTKSTIEIHLKNPLEKDLTLERKVHNNV